MNLVEFVFDFLIFIGGSFGDFLAIENRFNVIEKSKIYKNMTFCFDFEIDFLSKIDIFGF